MTCSKCSKASGAVLAFFGLLFLLQNLGVWDFWGIQWYTVAFLLLGAGSVLSAGCSDCQSCCCAPEKSKKRK